MARRRWGSAITGLGRVLLLVVVALAGAVLVLVAAEALADLLTG